MLIPCFYTLSPIPVEMKPEYKEIIMKAMPLIISSLEVDASFLAVFEANRIFIESSVQEIQVNLGKAGHIFAPVSKLTYK